MHSIQLPLCTRQCDVRALNKRFYEMNHIHNVLVKHGIEQLKALKSDPEYAKLLQAYKNATKTKKKHISNQLSAVRLQYGLSEAQLQAYAKLCGKQFRKRLSSQQVQKEATRVWQGIQKCIFSDGKRLHFKKYNELTTIQGKTNTNGVKFDKDALAIDWQGLHLPCRSPKRSKDIHYIKESLNHKVKYCEIVRKMFNNGWHYYVNVYLDGDAPLKQMTIKDGTMGIDPGVSAIAAVSNDKIFLRKLAPDCKKYNKKIVRLQQQIDRSKRQSNPKKYNPDGTIIKNNRDKWIYSKTCKKKMRQLTALYRQKAAYIKQSHRLLCDELIQSASVIYIEEMNFKALQKRAKKTERSDKLSDIKQKDSSVKKIHQYKRKKRFGKSLNNRAPASFLQILEYKASRYNVSVAYINTKTYKASQYNHKTGACTPVTLGQRTKEIGRTKVQRDLYSAFLIQHPKKNLMTPKRTACTKDFKHFVKMQNALITEMKENGISMKQCFGF